MNILGTDNLAVSQVTNDITIRNNLFEDVTAATWGGVGRFLLISGGFGITVDHNTVIEDGSSIVYAYSPATTGFSYTNNIAADNAYGLMGDNASPGNGAVAMYFPSGVFLDNVFAGSPASRYPTHNYYPATLAAVDFVDAANGDYQLAASSPYRAAGSDGADVGCSMDALAGTSLALNGTFSLPSTGVGVVGPTLTVSATMVSLAGPLQTTFANGPGKSGEWIGLYPASTSGAGGYVDWQWTSGGQGAAGAATSGTLTFPTGGRTLAAGAFVFRWTQRGEHRAGAGVRW